MPSKPEKNCSPSDAPLLYEYSVVRVVPRVEREEYINAGLLMMCKRRRWLRAAVTLDRELLAAFCPGADYDALAAQLRSFTLLAEGESESPIAALEAHERFRWLTAVRSACIATSRPHPGTTDDLDKTFDRLYQELILRT